MRSIKSVGVLLVAVAVIVGVLIWKDAEAKRRPSADSGLWGKPVPRVVALAPGLGVMMNDLGAGELLVGRHAYDLWSDQRLPVCGDQSGIDYEALLAVKPTDVLLQWGDQPLPARLTELASEHHWTVRNVPLLKLDDIPKAVEAIDMDIISLWAAKARRSADMSDEAREHARAAHDLFYDWPDKFKVAMRKDIGPAHLEDNKLARAGRVLLLHAIRPPAALGPGSYHHDILLRMGGQTATPTGKAYITMDVEDVLAMKPDAIVLIQPRTVGTPSPVDTGVEAVRLRLGPIGRLEIPAVANKKLAIIDDDQALIPGTNLARFADELRAILEGWSR